MSAGRFGDLGVRVASGAAMALVGLGAVWAGGAWFAALCGLVVGAALWEMFAMQTPARDGGRDGARDGGRNRARGGALAALGGGAVFAAGLVPAAAVVPLLLLPALLSLALVRAGRRRFAGFAALVALAGFGLVHLRADIGLAAMLWLALVVVATDVAGYFAGRALGGPKLWPRVSPKKTWSGTVAGWLAAGAVGAGFVAWGGAGAGLIGVSVALSMAAQVGDVSESAIKRRAGVKDSSALIPGHGGVMDRFDGMFGAALALLVIERAVALPALFGG